MSIIVATYGPVLDLYSGEQDTNTQKLPIGIWKATGSTLGDLTGGYIRFNAVPPTSARNKYLWSWQELSVLTPASASCLAVFNTGEIINAMNSIYYQDFDAGGAAAFGSYANIHLAPPLFTRIANPEQNAVPSFSIVINQNTNGAGYAFEMWGYVWGQSCRKVAGGPSRPQ